MKYDAFGLLLVLFLISDLIVGFLIGVRLIRLRNGKQTQLVTGLAMVFFGICARGLFHLMAEFSGGYITKPHYTVAYGVFYWIGRAALTIPCWIVAVRLMSAGKDDH